MRALRTRVSIHSSPADVFRVLTDFATYHRWDPWLKDVHGETREGALVTVRPALISMMGLHLKYRLEKIQANDFLRWREEAWFDFLFYTVREYQVYTRQSGSAIYSVRLSFHGPLAAWVGWFYGRAVRRGLVREAEALKRYCEQHFPLPASNQHVPLHEAELVALDQMDFSRQQP